MWNQAIPLCLDVQAMCSPPHHHQHIPRMSDYSWAGMLHQCDSSKAALHSTLKSYAPVPRTLRKQTSGLMECDWTLPHMWWLVNRDIELSLTDDFFSGFEDPAGLCRWRGQILSSSGLDAVCVLICGVDSQLICINTSTGIGEVGLRRDTKTDAKTSATFPFSAGRSLNHSLVTVVFMSRYGPRKWSKCMQPPDCYA